MRAVALVLALAVAPPALADYAVCQSLYQSIDEQVGDHIVVGRTAYPERELGFSVNLRSPAGSDMTVYFYDAGYRVDAVLAAAAFERAGSDLAVVNEQHRGYRNPRELAAYPAEGNPLLENALTVLYDAEGISGLREFLSVGRSGDCLVKIRYTDYAGSLKEFRVAVATLLEHLER